MKRQFILTPALAALLPAANVFAADAADSANPSPAANAKSPALKPVDNSEHANWISLGPQFGFNFDAHFKHVGNAILSSAGPASGGANHSYADGSVNVDSSGDLGGLTWNWGYQNAAQVQNGMLLMHSAAGGVSGNFNDSSDPQFGFDLAFGHTFGRVLGGHWGLQAAFDFTKISMDASGTSGSGQLITDAYALGIVVPPPAPYSGSYSGPGPLIGDTPSRTFGEAPVTISGPQSLDGEIYALRLGPYYDFQFCKRWSGRLGGGLALGIANLNYSFNETISYGGGSALNNAGSGGGTDFQAGGYVEAKLLYALTDCASLFAGAQYEYLGTFNRDAGNQQAQLDTTGAVCLLFGAEWKF